MIILTFYVDVKHGSTTGMEERRLRVFEDRTFIQRERERER
jgi:hypothetical protein